MKRGYCPAGGAKAETIIFPAKINNITLTERGRFKKVFIISGASILLKEKKVAERQAMGVKEILRKLKIPFEEKIEYYETFCKGSQICLIAEFEKTIIGINNLGRLGKKIEDIGTEATLELLKEGKSVLA